MQEVIHRQFFSFKIAYLDVLRSDFKMGKVAFTTPLYFVIQYIRNIEIDIYAMIPKISYRPVTASLVRQIAYLLFCLFCLILINPQKVFSATDVSGLKISTDTEWTIDGSPYYLSDFKKVDVLKGAILTIDPGVVVKLGNRSYLNVYGSIQAVGTELQPIYFTSIRNDILGGDTNGDGDLTTPSFLDSWGIYFNQSGVLNNLKNIKVDYSSDVFWVYRSAVNFENLTITDSEDAIGGYYANLTIKNLKADVVGDGIFGDFSSLDIKDSEVSGMQGYNEAIGLYDNSRALIDNTKVFDIAGNSGLGLYSGSSAQVTNSSFSNGLDYGIALYSLYGYNLPSLVMDRTTVEGFYEGGIFSYGGVVNISNSILRNNDYGLEIRDNSRVGRSAVSIDNSSITGNSGFGIYSKSLNTVNAINNWWGDQSGPYDFVSNTDGLGDTVFGLVSFSPWLAKDPFGPKGYSSVAFFPGIKASRLYTAKDGGEKKLWEPILNSDVEGLMMGTGGISLDENVYTKDVIDKISLTGEDIYSGFLDMLRGLVDAGLIDGWRTLPYDWRLSPETIVRKGLDVGNGRISYLKDLPEGEMPWMMEELENLAANSKNGKVTIVAHSYGGLVAKALLARLSELKASGKSSLIDKIDKLILVAVPELGTPRSEMALLHGDGETLLRGLILNQGIARHFAENMPSAYTLLPSEKYFSKVSDPVATFSETAKNLYGFNIYYPAISDFTGFANFLTDAFSGRLDPINENTSYPNVLDKTLLQNARDFHSFLDSFRAPPNIAVTEIAGWGLDTAKGISYGAKHICLLCSEYKLTRKVLNTIEGDGTVVYPSAINSPGDVYYLNFSLSNQVNGENKNHSSIFGIEQMKSKLSGILKNEDNQSQFIYVNKPIISSSENRTRLSVYSPVNLDVYASSSLHTGLIQNPDPHSDLILYEENIPNSQYSESDGDKFISLDTDGVYSVVLQGIGYGTFTFQKEDLIGDEVSTTTVFADIPITPIATARIQILDGSATSLMLDSNGDGVDDFHIKPGQEFDPKLFLQSMRLFVLTLGLPPGALNPLLSQIDKVSNDMEKGKITNIGEKIKKSIRFWSQNSGHMKKISEGDDFAIITMLSQLLNNLKL